MECNFFSRNLHGCIFLQDYDLQYDKINHIVIGNIDIVPL